MNENFAQLEERVTYSLSKTDLEKINYELARITGSTIVTGVGGSSVVAAFASKILNYKNGLVSINAEPRDLKYMNLTGFRNVLSCSYSGNNYGVTLAFANNLKHYLLSSKENSTEGMVNLTYKMPDNEQSFISLAATLVPCSVLLNYYLDNDYERITSSFARFSFELDDISDVYEIFSGYDTRAASTYLESTMTESGIGIPVVHDKYAYCHGRSTLVATRKTTAIYFNTSTELDNLLLSELPKYYAQVIVLDCRGDILGDYELLWQCMYLTKTIAEKKHKDLSDVDYCPIVRKLYHYDGKL